MYLGDGRLDRAVKGCKKNQDNMLIIIIIFAVTSSRQMREGETTLESGRRALYA